MREEVMERHSFLVAALLLRVLRVFVVKWFSALSSPRRHGEHGDCTKTLGKLDK